MGQITQTWIFDMSKVEKETYNEHAEQSVLGALLLDEHFFDDIYATLKPSDFYIRRHQIIYKTIIYLISIKSPIDTLTVLSYLADKNMLEQAGGEVYVFEISKNVPCVANAIHYAKMVKDCSIDRQIIQLAHEMISHVNQHTDDKLDIIQQAILSIAEDRTIEPKLPIEYMPPVLQSAMEENRNKAIGITTGYDSIDNIIDGMASGNFIIIAARPSMGKTLLAMNIGEHLAIKENKSVLMFSLEMTQQAIGNRLLASVSRVPLSNIKRSSYAPGQIERLTENYSLIAESKFIIDDSTPLSVIDIRAKSRRIKRKYGLDLIIIDYLQLLKPLEGDNEVSKLKYISNGLKSLAKELSVPIIALCQLNRDIERRPDKRPMMSDIRACGEIEQDADIVMFIDRPERYNENAEKNMAMISVVKNRDGKIGEIKLSFDGDLCSFMPYTPVKFGTTTDYAIRNFKKKYQDFRQTD